MSHKAHEARIRVLGAIELEAAAERLDLIRIAYEKEGCSDVGVILTPWIRNLRQGASDEHGKVKELGEESRELSR